MRGRQPPSVGDGADGGEVDEGEAACPQVLEAESKKAKSTKAKPPAGGTQSAGDTAGSRSRRPCGAGVFRRAVVVDRGRGTEGGAIRVACP